MTRLPGVVRQNMADFHSNPLDRDMVQLSPSVCSEKTLKPHITQPLVGACRCRDGIQFVLKGVLVHGCIAVCEGINMFLLSPHRHHHQPIFFSSILFMYFYYRGHPLLRWQGDVGLPSTGWECHVERMPHKYEHPNLCDRKSL